MRTCRSTSSEYGTDHCLWDEREGRRHSGAIIQPSPLPPLMSSSFSDLHCIELIHFLTLRTGVGPSGPFRVRSAESLWSSIFSSITVQFPLSHPVSTIRQLGMLEGDYVAVRIRRRDEDRGEDYKWWWTAAIWRSIISWEQSAQLPTDQIWLIRR